MGKLSFRFKSNFLDLLKCLNSLNWFIVLFSLINLSVCIYEDQIGKFDWRQSYVGRIKFAQFDTVSTAKKIIVATEENVLAALHLKTGQVVWRHVLESASSGDIHLLHVSDKVVTVSGDNPYLVRGWDTATGVLLWEWSLALNTEDPELSEWWVQDNMLVHMLPVFGSHIEVTTYNVLTGQNRGATSRLPAVWTNDGCVLAQPYYTCLSGSRADRLLLSMDVTSQAVTIISKPVSNYIQGEDYELSPLDGSSVLPGFVLNDKVLLIKDSDYEVMKLTLAEYASATIADSVAGPQLIQAWHDDDGFSFTAHSTATSAETPSIRALSRRDVTAPAPRLAAAVCARGDPHACRLLVAGGDDEVTLLQQGGRVLWSREEALANVAAVEFVDLPVSDLDAAIESEFDQKEGSIWAAFSRRLATQAQQLQTLIQSWTQQDGGSEESSVKPYRDYFNLHKIIVLVTDVGKIFGMDNLSGEILWRRFEPDLDTSGVAIFKRRSARHPPLDSCVTVVGKHEDTGNGLLITLNPITGQLLGERILHLDARPLQAALLHKADEEKLHALIILDGEENVQVFPQSAARLVENFYMYVADRHSATVRGYSLKYDGQQVNAQRTYTVHLGGRPDAGHRIAAVAAKSPSERVHSPGRVLGDRSVLYKYTNPNLALFVTEGPDAVHKDVVVATFVDVVSGAVVAAQAHRRARATPHAVHTDNFAAYVYYSDKLRRTEIATLELYEGATRWLPAGVPFSSLASDGSPIVERQSYIASATLTAAALTRTERSLTDKHLIMALTTGAIIEIPWAYLDPRRPVAPTQEQREEGLIPYAPELPLPSEAVLNYNRTVARVTGLHTAPAGLESTCLVLATGLDLFYTRVAPSKTFDLLKDDFDYYLITIVLAALIAATYSTKYFSSRKQLRNAWK